MKLNSESEVSVSQWLEMTKLKLQRVGITTAALDAELILARSLDQPRTWLRAHDDVLFDPTEADALLHRRLAREPIAYILGHKEFYGREFIVTPDVLIPRPESETMIELLKTLMLPEVLQGGTLQQCIDVGTGSGCLGITAKLEIPELEVTISDISSAALSIARQNAAALKVHVKIVESDLLANFQLPAANFQFILANLPYVDSAWERSPETNHEPAPALFAADGGMALTKKLIEQAPRALQSGGYLLLEADPVQHQSIIDFAGQHNFRLHKVQDYIVVLKS